MQRTTDLQSRYGRLKGQVVIIFAVASVLLIGMMALAVDVGFMLAEKRQVQAAADAGALAAAQASIDSQPWVDAGKFYGSTNADVPAGDVDVNNPPTQGRFAGDSEYIEVVVTKDVRRFFLGAVYQGEWQVTGRAVALAGTVTSEVALLALNPDGGGIQTSGSSYIETIGGSIQSNYNINASGHSTFRSTHQINSSNGIQRSGTVITDAGMGINESASNAPDPLEGLISPPSLPGSPGNIIPNPTVSNPGPCAMAPGWGGSNTTGTPGLYSCTLTIQGSNAGPFTFPHGNYRFNNAKLQLQYQNQTVNIDRGIWNFNGGAGLELNGHPTALNMQGGQYAFTNGAGLSISGNSQGNHIGGNFYFHGGGGIRASGTNTTTLYPGIYVFDGGLGMDFSGNAKLHFAPGNYEFWFLNGADLSFSGSATISSDPGAYAKMYFYSSGSNTADWTMSGWTDASQSIPSGQYYFDGGRIEASGSSKLRGDNVFMYFENGGYLKSSGMAGFAFTAPTAQIYPGYQPGVFLYSHPDNTAEFEWTGYTNGVSKGVVYLPSSPVVMSGYSNGKVFEGQFIADSYRLSGNNRTVIEYVQYIENETPKVYLVD